MSVITFGADEIGSIFKTLEQEVYGSSIYSLLPFSHEDHYVCNELYDGDKVKYQRIHLEGFISRLWIANQCAGIMQYGHHEDFNKEIQMFDSDKKEGHVLAEHELYAECQSLQYNLYTNGGNCFAQKKDLDFLENITSIIAQKHTDMKFRKIRDDLEELKRKREEIEN